jgi:hypothetical protein
MGNVIIFLTFFRYFDPEFPTPISFKLEMDLEKCIFQYSGINKVMINVGNGKLEIKKNKTIATGSIQNIEKDLQMSWDLNMFDQEDPLYLLPKQFYSLPFPKAKSLVISPLSKFNGNIMINNKTFSVNNWYSFNIKQRTGSLNHNWGSKHTFF